jgi:flagellar transcriptional activator FlhC
MLINKSPSEEALEAFCAIALIEPGAPVQILESELTLARDRMVRLYHEVVTPPKGLPPFSADWYMKRIENIHASLFYNTFVFLKNEADFSHLEALTKGYWLYLEHCRNSNTEAVLDLSRAWSLVRFFDAGILQVDQCCRCTGKFVTQKEDAPANLVCQACLPPATRGEVQEDCRHAASAHGGWAQ